jgi:hypothetical protein
MEIASTTADPLPVISGRPQTRGFLDLNNDKPMLASIDLSPYVDHVEWVCRIINREMEYHDIPIRASADIVRAVIRSQQHSIFIPQMVNGNNTGRLYEPQIKTICKIIAQIYAEPGLLLSVIGAMQCGKTGSANGVLFVGPMAYLLTGDMYYPVSLLPNRKGHEQQATNAFNRFLELYQFIKFSQVDSGKEITLSEYSNPENTMTLKQYRTCYQRFLFKDQINVDVKEFCPSRNIRRRIKKNAVEIRKMCREAIENGFRLLLIIDEIHWGAGSAGVQAMILNSIRDVLMDDGQGHIFVGFSATPWQLEGLSDVVKINHCLGDTYCGFNYWNGQPIDPDASVRPPDYLGYAEFAKMSGIPDFARINRSAYSSIGGFTKWNAEKRGKTKPFNGTYNAYCTMVSTALRDAIHWLLVGVNPKRGRGGCIRFCRRNDSVDTLLKVLKLDPAIQIVKYTGSGGEESIREAIDRLAPDQNRPYLVIVTGAARMADDFPAHCTYFLEFSDRITSLTALMQGLLGRACGYDKDTLVILADRNADEVDRFVFTKGRVTGLPASMDTVSDNKPARGGPRRTLSLNLSENPRLREDPYLTQILYTLEESVVRTAAHKSPDTLVGSPTPAFWDTLTEAVFTYIETHQSRLFPEYSEPFRLLRPGGVDEKGYCYDGTRIGFRKAEAVTGGLVRTKQDRLNPGGSGRGTKLLHPQVHYLGGSGEDKRLVSITLGLQSPIRKRQPGSRIAVLEKCVFHPLGSPQDHAVWQDILWERGRLRASS